MSKKLKLFLIVFSVLLSGCGSVLPTVKPFKMDIQQGNVVTSKMLLQLRPGMTKSQVRFIMGSPLVVDSFHKNRWDYFYQLRQGGKIVEQRRVILEFEKELLARVRGDVVPQGTAGADTGEAASSSKVVVKPAEPPKEKSWTEKLKFWKSDEKPVEAKPAEAKPEEAKPEEAKPEEAKPVEPSKAEAPQPAEVPSESSGADVPSVLAVPIGSQMESSEAPAAPGISIPEPPKAEPAPAVEQPEVKSVIAVPPPEPEPMPTPAPAVAKPEPVPEPVSSAPAPATPTGKGDDKMIFRMDKRLNPEYLNKPAPAPEPAPKAPAEVKPKTKKADEPLPPETEPTYFDRLLEKIGF